MTRLRLAALCFLIGSGLTACASDPSPRRSYRPLASGEVPLKTVEPDWMCAGTGFDAVLHGSPRVPASTWVVHVVDGRREEVVWPPGYSARFDPDLLVFDESGKLVGREGTHVLGGCPQPGGILVDLPTSHNVVP